MPSDSTRQKSTLFIQSQVLEHAELHVLLSMITPLSWLERVPTYKEQIENLKDRDLGTYGFLGYPLLQSADIVMYGEPNQELLVPVGEDQAPHVELTREIVRRFNAHFGFEADAELFDGSHVEQLRDMKTRVTLPPALQDVAVPAEETLARHPWVFKWWAAQIGFENFLQEIGESNKKYFRMQSVLREPAYLAAETPRLPGLDGRRMAKSYGNAIWLSDPPAEIRTKILKHMVTDPQRVRRTDPGRPEVCPVFAYHKLFSPPDVIAWSDQGCRTAGIGCVECKNKMADNLVKWIEPIQTRRKEFEAHPQQVWDILDAGSDKARKAAKRTMQRVRNAIFKWDDARKAAKT